MRNSVISAAVAALAAVASAPARADDLQAWPTLQATGKVNGSGLAVWAEGQVRFNDDVGRVLFKIARLGVGKAWEDGHALYGGWAWYQNDPLGGAETDEHRTWEQLGYPILKRGRLEVTGRMRLEQRFREEAPDVAHRMRQQVRAQYRLGAAGSPALVAHSELFTEFADTRWGVKARAYDQARTFGGVRLPLAKKASLETGYMAQTLNGEGRGGTNHIWFTTLGFAW